LFAGSVFTALLLIRPRMSPIVFAPWTSISKLTPSLRVMLKSEPLSPVRRGRRRFEAQRAVARIGDAAGGVQGDPEILAKAGVLVEQPDERRWPW